MSATIAQQQVQRQVRRPGRARRPERQPTASRFQEVFDREPSPGELAAFRAAHDALVLRLPARARRRAARVITRL